jgi:hypothetical protein
MNSLPAELWPWLALAALGLFHGVNPAMGWLFAVALGLHRHSRNVVLMSLLPIALGHAAAVSLALIPVLALGLVVDWAILGRVTGVALIVWAIGHALYGHRQRVRVGMQTSLLGLSLWSFLMASAHGAGLMLIPLVLPLCIAAAPARELTSAGTPVIAIAAVAVHGAAMLTTIGIVSIVVYNWMDVGILRRGWINFDLLWIAALLVCGLILLRT